MTLNLSIKVEEEKGYRRVDLEDGAVFAGGFASSPSSPASRRRSSLRASLKLKSTALADTADRPPPSTTAAAAASSLGITARRLCASKEADGTANPLATSQTLRTSSKFREGGVYGAKAANSARHTGATDRIGVAYTPSAAGLDSRKAAAIGAVSRPPPSASFKSSKVRVGSRRTRLRIPQTAHVPKPYLPNRPLRFA